MIGFNDVVFILYITVNSIWKTAMSDAIFVTLGDENRIFTVKYWLWQGKVLIFYQ